MLAPKPQCRIHSTVEIRDLLHYRVDHPESLDTAFGTSSLLESVCLFSNYKEDYLGGASGPAGESVKRRTNPLLDPYIAARYTESIADAAL